MWDVAQKQNGYAMLNESVPKALYAISGRATIYPAVLKLLNCICIKTDDLLDRQHYVIINSMHIILSLVHLLNCCMHNHIVLYMYIIIALGH